MRVPPTTSLSYRKFPKLLDDGWLNGAQAAQSTDLIITNIIAQNNANAALHSSEYPSRHLYPAWFC